MLEGTAVDRELGFKHIYHRDYKYRMEPFASTTSSLCELKTYIDNADNYINARLYKKYEKGPKFTYEEFHSSIPVKLLPEHDWKLDFKTKVNYNFTRIGDAISHLCLRITLSKVELKDRYGINKNRRLRWVHNLFHKMINLIDIFIGGMLVSNFNTHSLDCNSAFMYDTNHSYWKMIGNIDSLVNPTKIHGGNGYILPETILYLRIPLFPNGQGNTLLPIIALQYHNVQLEVSVNDWSELLIIDDFSTGKSKFATENDLISCPKIVDSTVVAEYILQLNSRRHDTAINTHELIIQKSQTIIANLKDFPVEKRDYLEIPFDVQGRVKTIYFTITHKHKQVYRKDYLPFDPILQTITQQGYLKMPNGINFDRPPDDKIIMDIDEKYCEFLPRELSHLILEYNTEFYTIPEHLIKKFILSYNGGLTRLNIPIDYCSTLHPFQRNSSSEFSNKGYYMYSFSQDPNSFNPAGAVDFSRLDVVGKFIFEDQVYENLNDYELEITFEFYTILKIDGGTGGFPAYS